MRKISFLMCTLLFLGFTLVLGQVGPAYAYGAPPCDGWWWCYCNVTVGGTNQWYQLTVNTDPSSLSGQVTGGGSYRQCSSVSFSSGQKMIQVSKDARYVFSRWSGDYTGTSLSGSVKMDADKTVTAVYQLQYYLNVTVQPSNVPSPDGGWYNVGEAAMITVPSQTVGGSNGTRFVFNGWSLDGNTQAGSPLNLQMNGPHNITAQYNQQYYLTISTDQGVPSGEGWYDANAFAQIGVSNPPSPSYGVSLVFNGWQGSVESSTSQSTRVMMNGPKIVIATWRTDSTILYVTIAAVLALVAGCFYFIVAKLSQNIGEQASDCKPQTDKSNYAVQESTS